MKAHRIAKTHPEENVLPVEAGQVMCPQQGVVDIERCWVCPGYAGLSTGRIEGVICRPERSSVSWAYTPAVE